MNKVSTYNLTISGSGGNIDLIGDDVDSNWDPDFGIIWLDMDTKLGPPYGTITINIFYINGKSTADISDVTISTQDAISGTGDELNGKHYHGGEDYKIVNIESNSDYISAEIADIPLEESTTGEAITVSGTFTAVK